MVYLTIGIKKIKCDIEYANRISLVPEETIRRFIASMYGTPAVLSFKVLGYYMGESNGFPQTKTTVDMLRLLREVSLCNPQIKIGNRVKIGGINSHRVGRVTQIAGSLALLDGTVWHPTSNLYFYAES